MILLLLSFNLPTSFVFGWFPTFSVCLPLPVSFSFSNFLCFMFLLYIYVLWLPWGFCIVVYIYVIVLSYWSLNFKCILKTLHLCCRLVFLISYFIFNCFVYPLTAYCGYRWFYYFCLLTSLLALSLDDFLPFLYACLYQWVFHFLILFLVMEAT